MRRITSLGIILVALAGCGSGDAKYSIKFNPLVSGMPFSCAASYDNIGTTKTTIQPGDFRMYVHDLALVRATGEAVPLKLTPDMKWQSDRIALLDFEDGTGNCMTNSPETHFTVDGAAPSHTDYTGLQFTVGVQPDSNHLSAETAMPPENVPQMWWSWVGGYRYLRIDVTSLKNQSWNFHLGAMQCSGASMDSITCKFLDQAPIALTNFNPMTSSVAMDLATLFADSDLDHQVDGMIDQVPGCMSGPGDPECPPLFGKLGLTFQSTDPGPAQTFFAVTP